MTNLEMADARYALMVRHIEAKHGPGFPVFRVLICDSCAATADLSIDVDRVALAQWHIGVDGPPDLCASCAHEPD